MTLLSVLIPLMQDLSKEMPEAQRYDRLLNVLHAIMPCDAVALLKHTEDGQAMVPLAARGLVPEALGRRFDLVEHPRLALFVERAERTLLGSDCTLPDPYDGLIDNVDDRALTVHDCLGCPLYVEGSLWGLLTLDALVSGQFEKVQNDVLDALVGVTAAAVAAAERMMARERERQVVERQAAYYREAASVSRPQHLLGQNKTFKSLMQDIDLVAHTQLTVLIQGETGTGKELVAEQLHARSTRAASPLVKVNCAALPEHLVESELFGHVRGAFTGATRDRLGRFEMADSGSLLLDEVGELPLSTQAKLLRVLQSGHLQRVGSDREHHVDVRVIAATNRDMTKEVAEGRFREDLYHRLSVYPLHVPPLRKRGDDVLLLAGHVMETVRVKLGLRVLRLSVPGRDALRAYRWPGNVRELEHVIHRATLRAMGEAPQEGAKWNITLQASHLGLTNDSVSLKEVAHNELHVSKEVSARAEGMTLRDAVDDFQRTVVIDTLAQCKGVWSEAARRLGVDRANLVRLGHRLGLR